MANHLAETSPHWEHLHPHAPHTASVVPVPGHSELVERLARIVSDVFLRRAHAQGQPAPLRVYSEDWDAGSTPAPTGATGPPVRLVTDVPMLDTIDAQLRQLRSDINAHVANVNAHPHDHVHTHAAGGIQFYNLATTDTDGDGVIDVDDDDDDGDGVSDTTGRSGRSVDRSGPWLRGVSSWVARRKLIRLQRRWRSFSSGRRLVRRARRRASMCTPTIFPAGRCLCPRARCATLVSTCISKDCM